MKVNHTVALKQQNLNGILEERSTSQVKPINFHFNNEEVNLIKSMVCKDITNEELQLFAHICKRTGLDPLLKQIYAVKRYSKALKKDIMTIQTAIDGYRLIAERTGKYSPGKESEFGYDESGALKWAQAFVKKMTPDGTWHEISSRAFWSEYVQSYKDDTDTPTLFWKKKPHIMLSKCAESLALRKAFPAELSGVYTSEEMQQDESSIDENRTDETNTVIEGKEEISPIEENTVSLSEEEVQEIEDLIGDDKERRENFLDYLSSIYKVTKIEHLPAEKKEILCNSLRKANKRNNKEKS